MRLPIAALLLLLSGCDGCHGCGCGGGPLAVGGEHPYRRCLAADPPAPRSFEAGGLTLHLEGRDLRVDGAPTPLRLAAFGGPAPFGPLTDAELEPVRAGAPHLLLLLGGLGDDEESAAATLGALAGLGLPVVVVAGGDDDGEVLDDAFDALDPSDGPVVDGRALRRITVGEQELILVSGAPGGRYARTEDACGLSADDLEEVADALGDPGGKRRWLVSWAAPAGDGPYSVGRGLAGVPAGAPEIAALAEAIGAAGGIFAWPRTSVMQPTDGRGARRAALGEALPDLRLSVAPLAGAPVEQADGRRVAPQPAFLELSAAGLAWVEGAPSMAGDAPVTPP